MKRTFKSNKVEGYFDCRIYNATKPREQWLLKGDNDTISFIVSRADNLEFAGENIKAYTDKNGTARQLVRVKVSSNCRFYDEHKNQVPRPTIKALDGKRFECYINGTDLGKNNGQMKANGLWASAILFKEVQIDDFSNIDFGDEPVPQQPQQPVLQQPQQQGFSGDLPF